MLSGAMVAEGQRNFAGWAGWVSRHHHIIDNCPTTYIGYANSKLDENPCPTYAR
ncbi:MAG: hypothetical protein RLY70_4176 [Planctomycetota bacterium]|jgi:hypothetical protein